MGSSRWLRRLAPWVIAALVLAVLVWRYSPQAIAAELARGGVLGLVPWTMAVAVVGLVVMSVADRLVFAAALGRELRIGDVLRGRAATAILASLHHGLASGGYGVWLARRTGSGAAPAVGAASYQVLSDLAAVFLFALPAALLGGALLPGPVGASAALVSGAGLAGVAALLLAGPRLAPRRWRETQMLAAWSRIAPSTFCASLLLRVATIAANIAATWGAARAFGLPIPIEALAAGLPITYLVSALPVNVLGLGATQAAWVALFGAHAPGAQILAFQFVYQLLGTAALVARGLPFLPGVLRDLTPRDAAPSATSGP